MQRAAINQRNTVTLVRRKPSGEGKRRDRSGAKGSFVNDQADVLLPTVEMFKLNGLPHCGCRDRH